jgi:hypothetical protein
VYCSIVEISMPETSGAIDKWCREGRVNLLFALVGLL